MKITAIRTFVGSVGRRSRALVKVETDEGIHGWGECFSPGPDLAIGPTLDYIFELIEGEDPRRIEFIMLKLFQQFRFPPGAIGLSAMSGLDHALWDISGKAAGLPVYMLLGGAVRDRIQVYRGIGGSDGEEAAAVARKLNRDYGITAFKTGPFRLDPSANRWGRVCAAAADFFETLRNHCDDNWEFAFDAHAKIFEPVRALQLAKALAPYDPLFYEEPLRPENSDAWARLRAQMPVPLATGEALYTRFEFLDLLSKNGADIIQPDICICGGLLEMRKIAAIAQAHYGDDRPAQPDGAAGYRGQCSFRRRHAQLQDPGVSPARRNQRLELVGRTLLARRRVPGTAPRSSRLRGGSERGSRDSQRIRPLGTRKHPSAGRFDELYLIPGQPSCLATGRSDIVLSVANSPFLSCRSTVSVDPFLQ